MHYEFAISHVTIKIQREGIEPSTSAVLRPRHNQLDHPCVILYSIHFKLYTINLKKNNTGHRFTYILVLQSHRQSVTQSQSHTNQDL